MSRFWSGPLAPFGVPTDDRRVFTAGGLTHRATPMPLVWQEKTGKGHEGSSTVARILHIDTNDERMFGYGDWLDETIIPDVTKAKYLVEQGVAGASVDLGKYTVEVDTSGDDPVLRYSSGKVIQATLVPSAAFSSTKLELHDTMPEPLAMSLIASGNVEFEEEAMAVFKVNSSSWTSMPIASRDIEFNADAAIQRILAWAGTDAGKAATAFMYRNPNVNAVAREAFRLPFGDIVDGKMTVIYHAIYAAAALLSGGHGGLPDIPDNEKQAMRVVISKIYDKMAEQFGDPGLKAPWDKGARAEKGMSMQPEAFALTAGAGPVAPPRTWFDNPNLDGPTQIRVEKDGRVYGHLAVWDTCHMAIRDGACVTPPRSVTGYAYFKTGEVLCDDDTFVSAGTITLGTGHASVALGYLPAVEHYDNTGTGVATVNAGEDDYGVWVAGAVCSGIPDNRLSELRRSPLSGDWRRVNGNLELVAALAVTTPGFPVTRVDGNRQLALVAAGVVSPSDVGGGPEPTSLTVSEDTRSVDIERVTQEVVASIRAQNRRTERLATIATADQMRRADRLEKLKGAA